MGMNVRVDSSRRASATGSEEIPVEFVVLHYTALPLQETLDIFVAPDAKVSAHLVIDVDGTVYELVPCLQGRTLRGAHAGESRLLVQADGHDTLVESFNSRSIGIEIVNLNGNVFPFTSEQYESLAAVLQTLSTHYPALRDPAAIVGHEHIAGFRGKVDPGRCFDWQRLYGLSHPGMTMPERPAVCSAKVAALLSGVFDGAGVRWDYALCRVVLPTTLDRWFSARVSSLLEGMTERL
jgi:N-acetylmuramoyl-L-alanine amidase